MAKQEVAHLLPCFKVFKAMSDLGGTATLKEVAGLISSTRESVSWHMRQLKWAGVVEQLGVGQHATNRIVGDWDMFTKWRRERRERMSLLAKPPAATPTAEKVYQTILKHGPICNKQINFIHGRSAAWSAKYTRPMRLAGVLEFTELGDTLMYTVKGSWGDYVTWVREQRKERKEWLSTQEKNT